MAHPLLEPVTSSTVEAIKCGQLGNEGGDMWSMLVEFKSGKIYRYIVPHAIVLQMAQAPSKGKFINQMKATYTGELFSADAVTALFSNFAKQGKSPRKKRKIDLSKFIISYPELSYFF